MSNVFAALADIWTSAMSEREVRKTRDGLVADFLKDLQRYGFWRKEDVIIALLLALLFTILRLALRKIIFKPFVRHVRMATENAVKFPESGWKALYYTSAWTYTFYLMTQHSEFFFKPESVWFGWKRGINVPRDIYVIYVAQLGFYIHSLYATFFLDEKRKDHFMMAFHHVVSIFLIVFSLAIRYHNIGLVLLFLHDLNDVVLEISKCFLYMKTRDGKDHSVWEVLANIGFGIFMITWFVMRIYWFFYKLLYSAGHQALSIIPSGPFYFFFNTMLWTVFLMNCYWYFFIIKAAFGILLGKGVQDTREVSSKEKKQVAMKEDEKLEEDVASEIAEVRDSLSNLNLGEREQNDDVTDDDDDNIEMMEVEYNEDDVEIRKRQVEE
ncbi:ceramide synthase 1-like [Oscarella lobularis]|uniref:ceramide synthase 1-like n=1 Tax=Oscarella lobularis TaxID=121494 RepID=UPI00331389E0